MRAAIRETTPHHWGNVLKPTEALAAGLKESTHCFPSTTFSSIPSAARQPIRRERGFAVIVGASSPARAVQHRNFAAAGQQRQYRVNPSRMFVL